jgi:hypothetical protein
VVVVDLRFSLGLQVSFAGPEGLDEVSNFDVGLVSCVWHGQDSL